MENSTPEENPVSPLFVKSNKWKQSELDHKSIEFHLPVKDGTVHGVGEMWASENNKGLLFVQIVTDVQGRNWAERIQTRYYLTEAALDHLKKHPESGVADFLLS